MLNNQLQDMMFEPFGSAVIQKSNLVPRTAMVEYKKLVPVINGHIWVKVVEEIEVADMVRVNGITYCHPDVYDQIGDGVDEA